MATSIDIFGSGKFGMLVVAKYGGGSGLISLQGLATGKGSGNTVMLTTANVGEGIGRPC